MPVSQTNVGSNAAVNVTTHTVNNVTLASGLPYAVRIAGFPFVIFGPIISVVYNGVALNPAGTPQGSNDVAAIYTRADGSGADGSPHDLVVTYTDQADNSNLCWGSYSGAHATTPFADYTPDSDTADAISIEIPNVTADDLAISVWGVINAVTVTSGTQDAQVGSGHIGVFVSRAGNGVMAGNQGGTPDAWVAAGLRVAAAGQASPPFITTVDVRTL